jgi:hypothetical protein
MTRRSEPVLPGRLAKDFRRTARIPPAPRLPARFARCEGAALFPLQAWQPPRRTACTRAQPTLFGECAHLARSALSTFPSPYPLRPGMTVRHLPYCHPDLGTGSTKALDLEYAHVKKRLTNHWARRVNTGGTQCAKCTCRARKDSALHDLRNLQQTDPAHVFRRRSEVLYVRQRVRVRRE